MASRIEKNESFKKAFVIKAIPFLSEVYDTCNLGYNVIEVTKLSKKHNVPTDVIPAMVKLNILTRLRNGKHNAQFHWKHAFYPPQNKTVGYDTKSMEFLAIKIYDKINLDIRTKKANKKLSIQQKATMKNKGLVPIIGSKRIKENKDQNTTNILHAMSSVYSETKNGTLVHLSHIKELVKREIENTTISGRIVDALIDGNYIKKGQFMQSVTPNLHPMDKPDLALQNGSYYTWVEQIPTDEHANFIKEMIKETTGNSRVNRIFEFLVFLSKIKTFTKIHIRNKGKEYGLTNNDQTIISTEVLDFTGAKASRMYKWKLSEEPTMELANKILAKAREYGNKYTSAYLNNKKTKSEEPIVKQLEVESGTKIMNKIIKIKSNKPDSIDSLKKTISMLKDLTEPLLAEKLKIEEKLIKINSKIKEGEDLLSIKERETTFINECSVFIDLGIKISEKESLALNTVLNKAVENSQRKKGQRHLHSKQAIIDFISSNTNTTGQRPVRTLDEIKKHFYPSTHWNDESKSLCSMLSYLKKANVVATPQKGIYQLK